MQMVYWVCLLLTKVSVGRDCFLSGTLKADKKIEHWITTIVMGCHLKKLIILQLLISMLIESLLNVLNVFPEFHTKMALQQGRFLVGIQ